MRITLSGLLAAVCFLLVPCVPIAGNYAIVFGSEWVKEGAVIASCITSSLLFFVGGIFFSVQASEGK